MNLSRRCLAVSLAITFTAIATESPMTVSAHSTIGADLLAATTPTGPITDPAVVGAVDALDALASGDRVAYLAVLGTLSNEVAHRVNVDPTELLLAWKSANDARMRAVLSALTQLGVQYRYAAASPGRAFDCSGLISWAWRQAGVTLPHQSARIIRSVASKANGIEAVAPGDVFWYPGHISMALGVGDAFIHAPGRGKTVELRDMTDSRRGRVKVGSPI